MPSIPFILPHWLYWSGLVLFPAFAIYVVHREKRQGAPPPISRLIAYMIWLCAGFCGMHRFYLRSRWGYAFIPLLAAVIYANFEVREARSIMSGTRQVLRTATYELDRAESDLKAGAEGAQAKRDAAKSKAEAARAKMTEASTLHDRWGQMAAGASGVILVLLLIDAALIPKLVRRALEEEARNPLHGFKPVAIPPEIHQQGVGEDPALRVQTRAGQMLDWVTEHSGRLVAYWTLLAVFVYYYEVVVRFLFNSPTNWVHESMFLMFGIQFLIAGAYAYKADSHVRVDVIYVKLPDRAKVVVDLLTSVFFFIFVGTMLATGIGYAGLAIKLGEVSFSEWAIQYWPVKLAIPVGAFLLLLQGLSKLIKDIQLLIGAAPLVGRG